MTAAARLRTSARAARTWAWLHVNRARAIPLPSFFRFPPVGGSLPRQRLPGGGSVLPPSGLFHSDHRPGAPVPPPVSRRVAVVTPPHPSLPALAACLVLILAPGVLARAEAAAVVPHVSRRVAAVTPPHPSLPALAACLVLILAPGVLARAEAAAVVPHVFADGATLVGLAAEGLDPDRYVGDKAKGPGPVAVVVVRREHVRWACYWRTAGAYGAQTRAVQGCPDPRPLVQIAAASPRWYLGGAGSGSTTRIVTAPHPPAAIPLGGTLWALVAAIGALVLVRRVAP